MRRIVILVLFLLAGCAYVHLLRVPEWTATLAATLCSPLFDLVAGHISPRTASLALTGTQALVVVALIAGLTLGWRHAWSRAWAWTGLPDGVIVAVGMWMVSQRQHLHDWAAELPPPLREVLRKPSFWGTVCGVALLCTIITVILFWTSVSDFLGGPLAPGDDAGSAKTTPLEIIYKLSLIIGGTTAFGLAAWRGWCHDVQTRTTAQGHITDRFIEAAKLLGSEQMASRLGGIFMLWRTGKDSKNTDDKRAVLDMLCAFIREPTPDTSCNGDSHTGGADGSRAAPTTHQRATMRNDVRAAASLLSKESTDAFPLPSGYRFDLTGAQLPGVRLVSANLRIATIVDANLTGANLIGANLQTVALARTNLSKANLSHANCSCSYFNETNFHEAVLEETDISFSSCRGANFSHACLDLANLAETTLDLANFTNANLNNANLMDARLTQANLTEATLVRANLTVATLNRALLGGANLREACLAGAALRQANLAKTNLERANLVHVNCTEADLTNADMGEADLSHANLSHANLSKADLTGTNLNGVNLGGANLARANLLMADLTGANLSRAYLCNTNLTNANFNGAFIYDGIDATGCPLPIPFTREHCADAASIEGAIFTGDSSPWPRPETASDGTSPTSPTLPSPPAAPSAGKD
ncbi:MAG TPA: pentapeptide repeat-containing protein [Nitratidesulfovibrio sp.]|nr:pentapeptide repeat-containing protein [Nitratidesulfovibrio sp.]